MKADGKEWGELLFRGPWIAKEYYKDPERSKPVFEGGWLHTGDVGTIDEEGYVRLVDRTKDLVKSGGEWISSVDLENLIMAHPAIAEAAVIGIPHSKWVERPLGCVVVKPGCDGHGGGAQGVPEGQGQGRLVDSGPLRLPGPDPQDQRGQVQQKRSP